MGSATQKSALEREDKQTIVPVSAEELCLLAENARLTATFIRAFHGVTGANWSLQDLDAAFAGWLHANDKLGYSEARVVEILGAGFGLYCASRLNMRWIRLTDRQGSALGLQGIGRDFRGFPFHSISKHIPDCECGFFGPVFISLKHARDSEAYRPNTLGRST
jgi:hypothetical protein